MSSKQNVVVIAVTPNLKTAFADLSIKGQGGFQALLRMVGERITKSPGTIRFEPDEFRRIAKYATTYGEGGYQAKLRLLVSQFVAQNFNQIIPN